MRNNSKRVIIGLLLTFSPLYVLAESVNDCLNRGNAYFDKKDYDRAIANYTRATQFTPSNEHETRLKGEVYTRRGNAYYYKKNYAKAISDYSNAIEAGISLGYSNRGNAYCLTGEYDKAIQDYNKAIELGSLSPRDFLNRGGIYSTQGNYDQAVKDCSKAIELSLDILYREETGSVADLNFYNKMLKNCRSVIRREVNKLNTAGIESYNRGDYSTSISAFNQALMLSPDSDKKLAPSLAKAYGKRGATNYLNKEYDKAINDFSESLKLNPEQPEILEALHIATGKQETLRHIQQTEKEEENNAVQTGVAPATAATSEVMAQSKPDSPRQQAQSSPSSAAGQTGLEVMLGILGLSLLGFFLALLPWRRQPMVSAAWTIAFLVCVFSSILLAMLVIGSSIWVAIDSSNLMKNIPGDERKRISSFAMSPTGWTIGNLILWLLVFPRYLSARLKYYDYNLAGPAFLDAPPPAPVKSAGVLYKAFIAPFVQVKDAFSPALKKESTQDLREQVKELMAWRKYNEARDLLARKKHNPGLSEYNLFLEIYVKSADYMRAKLTASQISQEINNKPENQNEYRLYLQLAAECRASEAVLAHQLSQLGVTEMLKVLAVRDNQEDFYSLAVSLEAAGETDLALKILQQFADMMRPYKDAAERFRRLKERKAAAPPNAAPKFVPGPVMFKTGVNVYGQTVGGRYEIKGDLGEGGMGVVYEAWDRVSEKKVAIKRMHSWLKEYAEEYGRFKREAEIVEKLKHPNIIGVQGIIEELGDIYLIFDYFDGKPLSNIIKERQRLPFKECRDILKGVCEAVHYAHKNNVIHRDLKPGNIMLNAAAFPMVMDFGLASELREGLTRVTHQTMSGTQLYMAPEQHQGIVKRESDIYAIGVSLYEMLTGELPFKDIDFQRQKNAKNYKEVSAKLPWLPAGIDHIIDRALEPEPSMRFSDALELYDELKSLDSGVGRQG